MSHGRPAAVLVAVVAALGVATALAASSRPPLISDRGVGPLRLGTTWAALNAEHRVGKLFAGCPTGPKRYMALAFTPRANVTFDARRRLIFIEGNSPGLTAKHVGIGSTLAKLRAAYPTARYTKGTGKDAIDTLQVRTKAGVNAFLFELLAGRAREFVVPGSGSCPPESQPRSAPRR